MAKKVVGLLSGRQKHKITGEFVSLDNTESYLGAPDSNNSIIISHTDGSRNFYKLDSSLTLDNINNRLSVNFSSTLDSAETIALIDSAHVQLRQTPQDFAYSSLTGAPTNVSDFTNDANYLDSNTVVGVIDTTYVQANQIQYNTSDFVDSAYVTTQISNLVDGAPVALDTLNELATALQNDSDALAALVTVVDTKLNTAGVTSLIDSAYIQLRDTPQDFAYASLTGAPTNVSTFTNDANYLDSDTVTGVIDASYIQSNQTTYDFLDSAEAIALIDSAHVQLRQTPQDFAYASLTGAPTNVSAFTNDAGYITTAENMLDSAEAIALIDSAYVQARLDSAYISTVYDQSVNTTDDVIFNTVQAPVTFRAKNDAGNTLNVGEVVYIKGVDGNTPTVDRADANDTNKMPAFGIVAVAANASANVEIVTFGNLQNVNTVGLSLRDTLYVSTTPGQFTNTKPAGESSLIQNIGKVVRVGSNGIIRVGGAGRTNATPNLDADQFFLGNDSNYSVATDFTAAVTNVVDSAYVQQRQDYAYSSLTGAPTNVSDFTNDAGYLTATSALDSAEVVQLIDSAYVQLRQTPQDFAYSSLTGAPTNVSSFTNDANYLDSNTATNVIDSAHVQARQTPQDFAYSSLTGAPTNVSTFTNDAGYLTSALDSIQAQIIIDSNFQYLSQSIIPIANETYDLGTSSNRFKDLYLSGSSIFVGSVKIAVENGSVSFKDSDNNSVPISNIDSSYVSSKQDKTYSSLTGAPTNVSDFTNDAGYLTNADTLDSAEAIALIDSAHVQLRQTPQDFAYSSLTGAPTNVSDFTNDANYLDSNTVTGVIDATYIQANQIQYNTSDFADSAYVTSQIDALIDGAPGTLNTLNEIAAALNDDDSAYATLVNLINAKSDLDSANVSTIITNDVDAAFINALTIDADTLGAQAGSYYLDYTNFTNTPNVLDSNNVIAIHNSLSGGLDSALTIQLIDSAYIQLRQTSGGGGLDSALTTQLIDSAYIQLRQSGSGTADSDTIKSISSRVWRMDSLGELDLLNTHTGLGVANGDANVGDIAYKLNPFDAYVLTDISGTASYSSTGFVTVSLSGNAVTRVSFGTVPAGQLPSQNFVVNQLVAISAAGAVSRTVAAVSDTGGNVGKGYIDVTPALPSGFPTSWSTTTVYANTADQTTWKTFGIDSGTVTSIVDSDYLELKRPAETIFSIVNSGTSAYTFTGDGFSSATNNPKLYITRGKTYKFEINASGHPFEIKDSSGGSAYNTGVTNNGAQTGNIFFTPDMNAPTSLIYQCTNHSGMVGDIVILDDTDEGDSATIVSLSSRVWEIDSVGELDTIAANAGDIAYKLNPFDGYVLSGTGTASNYVATGFRIASKTGNPVTRFDFDVVPVGQVPSDVFTVGMVIKRSALGTLTDPQTVTAVSDTGGNYSKGYIDLNPGSTGYPSDWSNNTTPYVPSATWKTFGIDSGTVTSIVDSAYVQLRQTSGGSGGLDSALTTQLIDSAYIQLRQTSGGGVITIQDEGSSLSTAASTINFVGSGVVASGSGATKTITISGGGSGGLDSALTTQLIDSAYIQLRQTSGGSGGLDSALTTQLIDSAYIQLRQTSGGSGGLDSALTTQLIDSDYVLSRTVATQPGEFNTDRTEFTVGGGDSGRRLFDTNNTLSLVSENTDVFLNGILQISGTDYTVDSSAVTFTSGVAANHQVTVVERSGKVITQRGLIHNNFAFTTATPTTSITGTDDKGATLDVSVGYADVFLNGILLNDSDDYSINAAGTTLTLVSATDSADIVTIKNSKGVIVTPHVKKFEYTTATPTTTISGNDLSGNALSYVPGSLQVHINGILLQEATDFTASTGNSIVLTNATDSADDVAVSAFSAPGSKLELYKFTADSGQTIFSGNDTANRFMSYEPGNIQVFLNGLLLNDSDDYVASNTKAVRLLTGASLNDELKVASFETTSEITRSNTWTAPSGTVSAAAGDKLFIDTSGGARIVTLPSSATMGDEIRIIDVTGNAATNNITVSRNSHNIQGTASDLVINIARAGIGLVYYNVAQGWVLIEN